MLSCIYFQNICFRFGKF
uniref:Uncharacterized protein n=1 Tax=Arundo donax TaxID=35708 RepID=A0A0A9SUR4_ARUDO